MILEEQEFPQERGLAGGGKKNMKTDPKLTDCRHSRMRSLFVLRQVNVRRDVVVILINFWSLRYLFVLCGSNQAVTSQSF